MYLTKQTASTKTNSTAFLFTIKRLPWVGVNHIDRSVLGQPHSFVVAWGQINGRSKRRDVIPLTNFIVVVPAPISLHHLAVSFVLAVV